MPMVGTVMFPYTPSGRKKARAYASKTGLRVKMNHGYAPMNRGAASYHEGGAKPRYAPRYSVAGARRAAALPGPLVWEPSRSASSMAHMSAHEGMHGGSNFRTTYNRPNFPH